MVRDIFMSRRWVRADLNKIQEGLKSKTHIISTVNEGYIIAVSLIMSNIKPNNLK